MSIYNNNFNTLFYSSALMKGNDGKYTVAYSGGGQIKIPPWDPKKNESYPTWVKSWLRACKYNEQSIFSIDYSNFLSLAVPSCWKSSFLFQTKVVVGRHCLAGPKPITCISYSHRNFGILLNSNSLIGNLWNGSII